MTSATCPRCASDWDGSACDDCGYQSGAATAPPADDRVMEDVVVGRPAETPVHPPADGTVTLAYRSGGAAATVNERHLLKFRVTAPVAPRVQVSVVAKLDGHGTALRATDDDLRPRITLGPGRGSGEFAVAFTAVGAGVFGVRSMRLVVETTDGPTEAYDVADHSIEFAVVDPRAAGPAKVTHINFHANDVLGSTTTINAATDAPAAVGVWTPVPLDGPVRVDVPPVVTTPRLSKPTPSPAPPSWSPTSAVRDVWQALAGPAAALGREAERAGDFTTKAWVTTVDGPADRPCDTVAFGDGFLLRVYADEPSYCMVVSTDADGATYVLLQDHGVPARRTATIEGPTRAKVWKAGPPAGVQRFYAFFADQPVTPFGPGPVPRAVSSVAEALAAFHRPPVGRRSSCQCEVDVRPKG